MISGYVQRLNLSCYRQDFNFDPLPFWQAADEPERMGIHEVRHMMGLYSLWDALLTRFPHLIIDDCASGGRRIDIEMLSRSIPLWRSDYQCRWDADPETAQVHNTGISWWIPYSGTGVGCIMGDLYRLRSCYSNAMVCNWWGYDSWDITDDQPLDLARAQLAEYRRVQEYFSCDYYPLGGFSSEDTGWSVSQYNRPEQGDGILLAFRRPDSPLEAGRFFLEGLESAASYRLEDQDSHEEVILTGQELMESGLSLVMLTRRSSRLVIYQKI
jgi:alpha-galactosidase